MTIMTWFIAIALSGTTQPPAPLPHLVMIAAEDEYETVTTLPKFAAGKLPGYRTTLVTADPNSKHRLPKIAELKSADVLLLGVRRRPLVEADLKVIKDYVGSARPLVAIRTSSHAFAPKKGEIIPQGVESWETFDREILGCHYTGHFPNSTKTEAKVVSASHPIMKGISVKSFLSPSWLYKSNPLAPDATLLLSGQVGMNAVEPVAWAREKTEKRGRVFYTCLGHRGDFEIAEFTTMLAQAVDWVNAGKSE
jgi:hypothetical protein